MVKGTPKQRVELASSRKSMKGFDGFRGPKPRRNNWAALARHSDEWSVAGATKTN